MEGFEDMRYGVSVARKGGLTTDMTFNALTGSQMRQYLVERKKRIQQ
jgi:DNA polymerase (family 10)